ncbi:hypothetical protein K9F62_09350 [Desulfovibrio sp. JY]|nr:hypothetical protein K9F62_09350 [Desulfovibrio sp. JY]
MEIITKNVVVAGGSGEGNYVVPVGKSQEFLIDFGSRPVKACWFNPIGHPQDFGHFEGLNVRPGTGDSKHVVILTIHPVKDAQMRIFIYALVD